jgi:four helix bundle protein
MKDFRKLKVWESAHKVTLNVYHVSKTFPKEEMFGLSSQIRRSAVSVPSNIAEGCGRGSDSDFARFLQIAMGSASELEYQILLSFDLKYINNEMHQKLNNQITEVKLMLSSLLKKLKADS